MKKSRSIPEWKLPAWEEGDFETLMNSQTPVIVQENPLVLQFTDIMGNPIFVSEDADSIAEFSKKTKTIKNN